MKKFYSTLSFAVFITGILMSGFAGYGQDTTPTIPKMKQVSTRGELSTISVNPNEGRVNELSSIKISFVGVSNLSLSEKSETFPYMEDEDGNIIYPATGTQGNTLTCSFSPAITEEGTYLLVIPESFCILDGVRFRNTLSYRYAISSSVNTDIIFSAPEGETVTCQSDFLSYFVLEGGLSGMPLAGKPLHYVLTDDELYLYNTMTINPYGGVQTESYIRGKKIDGNTYRFEFPQAVYENFKNGKAETWYLNHLLTAIDQDTQSGTYSINTNENYADFRIEENGDVVWINCPAENDSSTALGMTDEQGKWTGFANIRSTYLSFDAVVPMPPADIQQEDWTLTCGPSNNRQKRDVKVAFEDNDVWIQGISKSYLPEAWIHGVINGNYIEFDPFMGECEMIGQYLFAYTYMTKPSEKRDQLKLRYYKNENAMTSNHDILINPNEYFYYAVEYYERPELTKGSTGIKSMVFDNDEIVSSKFYTLDGCEVSDPCNGLFIREDHTISGKIIRTKIIK
ncbi:MAG: hypothetical protein K2N05_02815 [Muribaculaceae bacterium]|nr:hypothetical protein [Muribaculaceae bacterium]